MLSFLKAELLGVHQSTRGGFNRRSSIQTHMEPREGLNEDLHPFDPKPTDGTSSWGRNSEVGLHYGPGSLRGDGKRLHDGAKAGRG